MIEGEMLAQDAAGTRAEGGERNLWRQAEMESPSDGRGTGLNSGAVEACQPAGKSDLVIVKAGEEGSGRFRGSQVTRGGDSGARSLQDVEGNAYGTLKIGEKLRGLVRRAVVDEDEFGGQWEALKLRDERGHSLGQEWSSATGGENQAYLGRKHQVGA